MCQAVTRVSRVSCVAVADDHPPREDVGRRDRAQADPCICHQSLLINRRSTKRIPSRAARNSIAGLIGDKMSLKDATNGQAAAPLRRLSLTSSSMHFRLTS